MNCFCNLFDNEVVWLIIIALLILNFTCNGCSTTRYNNNGCGCGCGCNG